MTHHEDATDAEHELETLLGLDGTSFGTEAYVVEISAKRVKPTTGQPHGIDYALVLRPTSGGSPWVRYDNAHGVGSGYKKMAKWDHRHQGGGGELRPYRFQGAAKLLGDFWGEVKRVLTEKGVSHDL
ncbi:MAG: hypothetical protein HQL40_05290 [Alphaproteobacteria bacterium]|nr:hypothetical protein [Alphaproteobacteria bacterium]